MSTRNGWRTIVHNTLHDTRCVVYSHSDNTNNIAQRSPEEVSFLESTLKSPNP
jgi:hypothetical protein